MKRIEKVKLKYPGLDYDSEKLNRRKDSKMHPDNNRVHFFYYDVR